MSNSGSPPQPYEYGAGQLFRLIDREIDMVPMLHTHERQTSRNLTTVRVMRETR